MVPFYFHREPPAFPEILVEAAVPALGLQAP
jgi:hypothetical protein